MADQRHEPFPRPGASFLLLSALLVVLWVAGGASRADALGQAVVRAAALSSIAVTLVFAARPAEPGGLRPASWLLAGAIALMVLQLVPLPPALWQALPGRDAFAQAAAITPGAWRPLAIVPDGAVNAGLSLVVPAAVLSLLMWMPVRDRALLPGAMLVLVLASMLLALLQFSGAGLGTPFINDGGGQVSGNFANRNHLALFLAMGCVIAPVWAFGGAKRSGWRGVAAVGMLLVFVLMILASGSRAGLALGGVAVVLGLLIVWRRVRSALGRAPRWALPAIGVGVVALVMSAVLVSILAGRAEAVSRALSASAAEDMRARSLPAVLDGVRRHFPAGSGFGGFDPVFRMGEPEALLQPRYLNHAHNDFVEVALDGGLPGLLLLLAALLWWLVASARVWRDSDHAGQSLARLGSAILVLVLLASAVDYPARTPMIMAVIAVATAWLGGAGRTTRSALPAGDQHL